VDILHLIDRLEEMAAEARKLPVGGGAVISRQRLLDLIDRMRVAVPAEVYDARELLEKRDEILREAEAEAARMLAEARERLEEKLNETVVVQAAQERSREIIAKAEERGKQLLRDAEEQARARLDEAQEAARSHMREADVYALQTLRRLESELTAFLNTVRKGIDTLEQRAQRPGG
jgi:vacuolar-type H+-ATPase subunit H